MSLIARLLKASPSSQVQSATTGTFATPSAPMGTQKSTGRMFFGGGTTGGSVRISSVEYILGSTLGNPSTFGNLTIARRDLGATASSVRGVFAGGTDTGGTGQDRIDYFATSTLGDATTFGTLSASRGYYHPVSGSGNNVRGIFAGSYGSGGAQAGTWIGYITIASTGNETSFGSLSSGRNSLGACSSPVRSVFAGGDNSGAQSTIDYINIHSTGNALSFGSLTVARWTQQGASSNTRGVFGQGATNNIVMDYVTIASTGNATSFGNCQYNTNSRSSASNGSTGVWAGGGPSTYMERITIASQGDGTQFGQLTAQRYAGAGCGDSHGGIDTSELTDANWAGTSARALAFGGNYGSNSNRIDYFNVQTLGNFASFGTLNVSTRHGGAYASTTRAVYHHGVIAAGNADSSSIDYVTIASTGNATSFGTSATARPRSGGGASNSTRGLIAGAGFGNGSQSTSIEYTTIATTGNGTSFGSLAQAVQYTSAFANSTRYIKAGGYYNTAVTSALEYVTIATTGNATSFGTMIKGRENLAAFSTSVYGFYVTGDDVSGVFWNLIEKVTIASTGNGTWWGQQSVTTGDQGGTSNDVRGVTWYDFMQYMNIASGGMTYDFGNLNLSNGGTSGTSAYHGGLQ